MAFFHFLKDINLKKLLFLGLLITGITGCSTTGELLDDTTTPPVTTEAETPLETTLTPSKDWHLLPANNSPYYGTAVEKAYAELLANKSPRKEVVVAIIDSGTDVEHEDLSENIWVNQDEIPGNNIDDDNNGYVDDINGWNFIGGPNGTHLVDDTYEVTRLYAALSTKYEGLSPDTLDEEQKKEYDYYLKIKSDFEAKRNEVQQTYMNLAGFAQAIESAKLIFGVSDLDSVSAEKLIPNQDSDTPQLKQAKQVVSILRTNDFTEQDIFEARDQYESLAKYGVNPNFDPRHIVGDNYNDLSNRYYGNNDVSGPRNDHGTHVAGIVGAVRNNNLGINGIADIKLMIIRTVPNGDERDKDVANAIRYAVENGADIINMSFGKSYSPQKWYVDDAIRFADSAGVLLVHGAGNDGNNIDTTANFPSKHYTNGGTAQNFINVGASSWEKEALLAANFSNYGKNEVDLFAPGVSIYSTFPNNNYKANDGTSMASPVVAGIAALIMTYYPDLTATQIKDILMKTVTKPEHEMVQRPGNVGKPVLVPFSSLSVSGGIVNAYNALKLADELSNY